jgi:hypothetical protein
MQTFTTQKTISAHDRQTYSGDISTYGPVLVSPADTCYLRPLTEEQAATNGVQFGYGFSIIVECDVDLREGDHIAIEGVTYTIRGIVNHDRGNRTRYKRALALKETNQ